jgi:hypothetical protein
MPADRRKRIERRAVVAAEAIGRHGGGMRATAKSIGIWIDRYLSEAELDRLIEPEAHFRTIKAGTRARVLMARLGLLPGAPPAHTRGAWRRPSTEAAGGIDPDIASLVEKEDFALWR